MPNKQFRFSKDCNAKEGKTLFRIEQSVLGKRSALDSNQSDFDTEVPIISKQISKKGIYQKQNKISSESKQLSKGLNESHIKTPLFSINGQDQCQLSNEFCYLKVKNLTCDFVNSSEDETSKTETLTQNVNEKNICNISPSLNSHLKLEKSFPFLSESFSPFLDLQTRPLLSLNSHPHFPQPNLTQLTTEHKVHSTRFSDLSVSNKNSLIRTQLPSPPLQTKRSWELDSDQEVDNFAPPPSSPVTLYTDRQLAFEKKVRPFTSTPLTKKRPVPESPMLPMDLRMEELGVITKQSLFSNPSKLSKKMKLQRNNYLESLRGPNYLCPSLFQEDLTQASSQCSLSHTDCMSMHEEFLSIKEFPTPQKTKSANYF